MQAWICWLQSRQHSIACTLLGREKKKKKKRKKTERNKPSLVFLPLFHHGWLRQTRGEETHNCAPGRNIIESPPFVVVRSTAYPYQSIMETRQMPRRTRRGLYGHPAPYSWPWSARSIQKDKLVNTSTTTHHQSNGERRPLQHLCFLNMYVYINPLAFSFSSTGLIVILARLSLCV